MSNMIRKSLMIAPALFATVFAGAASANETLSQVNRYAAEGKSMGQVTSISQLRDVQPTDWAFQALQSLVERYGCIAGYPDGTYRGNRAMTRYEFAAGLNACLDRVNELIASATADLVTKEDLAVLQRLQEEFQAELATLRGRVDALEARTAELEANQFSTTTKLAGYAYFDIGSAFGGEKPDGSDVEDELTLGYRLDLDLNTSFTGKDLLYTRLGAGNFDYVARTGTAEASLDHERSSGNGITLQDLWYRFPVGKANVFFSAVGLEPDEVAPTTANLIGDGVTSFFVGGNPLSYNLVAGAGAGFNYQLTPAFNVALAYLGADGQANLAGTDLGLTSGDNTIFSQLTFTPNDKLTIAATYNHAYYSAFDAIPAVGGGQAEAATVDAFGVNASFALSPAFNISGWGGWGSVDSKDSNSDGDLFTWAVQLGFPDLFRKGNLGGVSIGAFPYFTDGDGVYDESDDAPIQAQAFYRFKVSDNISIQPGLAYIASPGGDSDNDSIWIGSVRTKFSF